MKAVINVCVFASILICGLSAQDFQKPALRQGISVQMPVAGHAVEMRAADEPNSTVVVITADGKLFDGITPTDPAALAGLPAGTVYVKADSRAPFQKVLAVLDALRGKSVVLLSAAPANAPKREIISPYGIKLTVF